MRPILHQPPTFDHLDLLERDPLTVARFQATLARGGLMGVAVEHEHDDSCCQREPWPLTLVRLLTDRPAEVAQ